MKICNNYRCYRSRSDEAVLEKENKGSLVMLTACRFYSETLTLPEEVYRKYATVWKTEELDEQTLLERS